MSSLDRPPYKPKALAQGPKDSKPQSAGWALDLDFSPILSILGKEISEEQEQAGWWSRSVVLCGCDVARFDDLL